MKAYVIVTGILFGLLTLLHLWRIFFEGLDGHEAVHIWLLTSLTAVLCAWAVVLLRRAPRT